MPSNTAWERLAIASGLNLSDAHARAPLGPKESQVIDDLRHVFHEATHAAQPAAEAVLIAAFETLGAIRFPRPPLLSYSSSSLVTTMSSLLRCRRGTVLMQDPSFDNIRDLLTTAGISLIPISEQQLLEDDDWVEHLGPEDSLWLASPANPTGIVMERERYAWIAQACAAHNAWLVVDHSFRLLSPTMKTFDQYEILEATPGLTWITLEDTGKSTSLLDLKVGLLGSSADLAADLTALNEELLLDVSPFNCLVIGKVLTAMAEGDLSEHVWPLIRKNAAALAPALETVVQAPIAIPDPLEVPLLWIDAGEPHRGETVAGQLRKLGVHVLPGTRFFMDGVSGRRFLRVALLRDPHLVSRAVSIIRALNVPIQRGYHG